MRRTDLSYFHEGNLSHFLFVTNNLVGQSITFYLSDDMIDHWKPKSTGKQGGQSLFTDLAIKACLTLRLVFKQGLRQTEGLVTKFIRNIEVRPRNRLF